MLVDDAIRTRRTTKNFTDEPLAAETVAELLEFAQWAPNHNLTVPWRFRLVGPESTAKLIDVAPPDKKPKVVRAQTRVLVSCVVAGDPVRREEDLFATAAAVQNLLLAATARGIDSFWQSPTVAGLKAARSLLKLPENEQLVAVVHLGRASGGRPSPKRPPLEDVYSQLP